MLQKIIKISRPRFWIYLLGPFLFGSAAAYNKTLSLDLFTHPAFWIFLFIFLIFGNYFIYGINDYYDFDTDQHNAKKDELTGKEYRLAPEDKSWLKYSVYTVWVFAFFGVYYIWQQGVANPNIWLAIAVWVSFWFIGYAYSTPPIRFKARRLVDSLSNGYYAFPGLFIYIFLTGESVSWEVFFAVILWNAGMHFYSAIPDIQADTKAGLNTSAMFFGFRKSLFVSSLVWLASLVLILLSMSFTGNAMLVIVAIGLVYVFLPLFSLSSKPKYAIEKLYWYFPYINLISGFILFWLIVTR